MDYEKAYKEALERADTLTEKYGGRDFAEYVFPELRESEDERIRKALVEYHKEQFEKQKINTEGDFARGYDCGYEACLNSHGAEWFEKQKHPNGCFTCDEYKKGYEEGRRNGFTAGYNKAMKEVEQKGQKPAERSEDLDIDSLREWSMRFAPDIREYIEATAYHFYNLGYQSSRSHWKPSEDAVEGEAEERQEGWHDVLQEKPDPGTKCRVQLKYDTYEAIWDGHDWIDISGWRLLGVMAWKNL